MPRPTTHDDLVRKSRGITSAHKGLAGHTAELTELKTRLRQAQDRIAQMQPTVSHVPGHQRGLIRLSGRIKALDAQLNELLHREATGTTGGKEPSPTLTAAWQKEFDRLQQEVRGYFTDLDSQMAAIRDRLDEHDLKFANHGERIEAVEVQSNANATAIASLRSRVDERVHPALWIASFVGAILGGLFMAVYDWSRVIKVSETTTTVGNPALDSWFGITLGALVGFFVVLAIGMLFSALAGNDEQEVTTASAASASSRIAMRDVAAPPTAVQPVIPQPASVDRPQPVA
ncbi:MAG: hypothetical protein U0520_01650 [Candidatus Saccharimonadales bacterium]